MDLNYTHLIIYRVLNYLAKSTMLVLQNLILSKRQSDQAYQTMVFFLAHFLDRLLTFSSAIFLLHSPCYFHNLGGGAGGGFLIFVHFLKNLIVAFTAISTSSYGFSFVFSLASSSYQSLNLVLISLVSSSSPSSYIYLVLRSLVRKEVLHPAFFSFFFLGQLSLSQSSSFESQNTTLKIMQNCRLCKYSKVLVYHFFFQFIMPPETENQNGPRLLAWKE